MAAAPSQPAPIDKRPDSRRLADFAAKAAETFVSAYYAASDSPQRTNLVPTLYIPTSSIVWNGTPISGQQELTAMLNSMPGSKHEVQAFDCHALGGAVDGGKLRFRSYGSSPHNQPRYAHPCSKEALPSQGFPGMMLVWMTSLQSMLARGENKRIVPSQVDLVPLQADVILGSRTARREEQHKDRSVADGTLFIRVRYLYYLRSTAVSSSI